ncbi:G-protein coupled receptor Mth2-like [Cloeon dipterum]|uniref:G-protein coupled receptor Mth2-like n=1 Tax=Cloeon dipterum TaxID=197152 RepID=UPI00321F6ED0
MEASLVLVLLFASALGDQFCEKHLRAKVLNGTRLQNGKLEVELDAGNRSVSYEEGTFWQENGFWWVCPCAQGNCIRLCKESLIAKLNITKSALPESIEVWNSDRGENQTVPISEHFNILHEADSGCAEEHGSLLDGQFRILSDGSLFFPYSENSTEGLELNTAESCLIPQKNNEFRVYVCEQPADEDLKFQIYKILVAISVVSLTLTLVALCVSPERHSVHMRSVVFQSGSLLVAFGGTLFNYATGHNSHFYVCRITAYVIQFSSLASFFWLNVMCIDIYNTFTGSNERTSGRAFVKLSVYAWCTPLLISIITVAVDCLSKDKWFSPGIGIPDGDNKESCWFKDVWSQLLYFNGPVLLLLLVNCFLFFLTVWKLTRAKQQVDRVLRKNQDSQVAASKKDRAQLWLFVRLFLLMGCTWFLEIISWAVNGQPTYVWYLLDAINGLRGVFIFWFCVLCNEKRRTPIRQRINTLSTRMKIRTQFSSLNISADRKFYMPNQ